MTRASQEKKNSDYLEAAEEGELETLVTLLDGLMQGRISTARMKMETLPCIWLLRMDMMKF